MNKVLNDVRDLERIEAKLDALTDQIAALTAHQARQKELIDEMGPILREATGVMIGEMDGLEKRGYFAFGRELVKVLDTVVTSYSEEDVQDLGRNVVSILDTIKSVTQPDILGLANEAADAVHDAKKIRPKGVMGMLRESSDQDVRRGMAVMLEVLRHVGRGARTMNRKGHKSSARPERKSLPAPESEGPSCGSHAAPEPPPVVSVVIDGAAFDAKGFLVDPESWTPELAVSIADREGIHDLTDGHWKVIEFVRGEFFDSGKSPNIRRLSKGSGVSTREIYALFPIAPGVTVAKIAGVPKPKGCI